MLDDPHRRDDAGDVGCQVLRSVNLARSAARGTEAFQRGLRDAALLVADVSTVTGFSLRAMARHLGVSERLVAFWADIDRPERAPLAWLFALPAHAHSAAVSLAEIRTMAAAPSRSVEGQLCWLQERLGDLSRAARERRDHDALALMLGMREDLRGLGVLVAREMGQ